MGPQDITQHVGNIAVLGISCRFPGCDGYRQYWDLLAAGRDAVAEIPQERWPAGEFYSRDPAASNASVSKWGGFLDRIDEFDHRFFNISAREAKAMDPRQRILLEEVWRALEDSTIPLERLRKMRTAVFVGMMSLDESSPSAPVDGYAGSGSAGCMLANRVSHFFDFSGPSLGIDTASSSSLVAIHQAKEALLSDQADYAVVGGISLNLTPWKYISFSKARMLSPDGRCKAFDRSANGYAPGEGVGVLVLQRADRARADRNFAHGLIKGSAINHGGLSVSLTAPQVAAQRDVIERAQSDAGVSPEKITYVEAHGSGTPLGDPIEVEALVQAFRRGTDAKQFCHLGSVKTNIGHLEPAAGIAGVIKVLVMMKHRSIPASLHLKAPNPMLDLARSPFKLVDRLTPWGEGSDPLRAGVSSFGFGGVNSHVVMETAPVAARDAGDETDRDLRLPFILSARTPSSLRGLIESWLAFVRTEEFERASWRDICGTLLGRKAFDCRAAWWVSKRGLEAALAASRDLGEVSLPVESLGLALGSFAGFERAQIEKLAREIPLVGVNWEQICEGVAETCGRRQGLEAAEFSGRFWDCRPALWELCTGLLVGRVARGWLPNLSLVTGEGTGLDAALCISGMLGEREALRHALNPFEPNDHRLDRPRLAFFDPSRGQMVWPVEIPQDYLPELLAQAILSPSEQRDLIRKAGELAEHQPTFRKFLDGWQVPLEQAGENLWGWWKDSGVERVEEGPSARVSLPALVAGDALRRLNRKWDLGRRGLPSHPRFLEALALLGTGLVEPVELVRFFKGRSDEAAEWARVATARARGMKNADRLPLLASLLRRPVEGGLSRGQMDGRPLAPEFFSANFVVRAGKLHHRAPASLSLIEPGAELASHLGHALVAAWRAGVAVAWERTPWADGFSRLPLPSYCFDRARFGREPALSSLRPAPGEGQGGAPFDMGQGGIEKLQADLNELLVGILRVERGEVDEKMDLREHGMESVALTDFAESIGRRYGMELDPVLLYEHPSLRSLARYLVAAFPAKFGGGATPITPPGRSAAFSGPSGQAVSPAAREAVPAAQPSPGIPAVSSESAPRDLPANAVAIIGMACRFPKAANPAQFWENLAAGADLVTEVPADRWRWQDYFGDPHGVENRTLSRWGGFVEDAASFDAAFFKISPKEAELMDPQQRWMLELAWEALEDAGYNPSGLRGSATGVFVGVCNHDYQALVEKRHSRVEAHTATGGHFSIIPNRISYFFDWRGPSLAVDTACSSSLVALDAAVKSLQQGDCALAVAGGVNLCCVPGPYLSFDHAGMLSKDGRCKAFDKAANGYVRGEGAGILLLKPLARAIADGDHVHAVIRATAVNHGGSANSLTAPNPNAQADLLTKAYRAAGFSPATVGYIEAHGTGTKLGDPIEVAGLKKAFSDLEGAFANPPARAPHCALGSVKANIGHLESAAGIAGVIKVVLALRHRVIPGLAHFVSLNPQIDLDGSPFYIARDSAPWLPARDASGRVLPLRAGVSSFGFGGANAHVVLEEPPVREEQDAADETRLPEIFPLSARTQNQLKESVLALASWLKASGSRARFSDVAHTLQVGREALEWRLAVVASGRADLLEGLGQYLAGEAHPKAIFRGQVAGNSGRGRLDEGVEDREFCAALARNGRLDKLATFWAAGSSIAWRDLFPGRPRRRISMPTYPFSKDRFWVADSRSARPGDAAGAADLFLLEKTWKECPLPPNGQAAPNSLVAILDGEAAERIWEELRKEPGRSWIVVRPGPVGLEKRPGEWELPLCDADAGLRIGRLIAERFPGIRGVLHLVSGPSEEGAGPVELGAIALYQRLLDGAGGSAFSMVLATEGIQPWKNATPGMKGAALTGLVRMLGAEYGEVTARAVDLDRGGSPRDAARLLLAEMGVPDPVAEVCYREGVRFGPTLAPYSGEATREAFRFDPARVYVISGGTGGIGLELAGYASSHGARKMVLMSRQPLPDREEWSDLLSRNGDGPLAGKIRRLVALEQAGVSVALTAIPLTAKQELAAFFNRVRLEYGEFGGVIHCAGQVDPQPVRFLKKPMSALARMTTPKIAGMEGLAQVFEGCDLQFFVLFSSVVAVAPALAAGFSDYALANGFLDFFASWQRSRGRKSFRSVSWPLWEHVGMGQLARPKHQSSGVDPISLEQGLSLMGRILSLADAGDLFPVAARNAELPSGALLGLARVDRVPPGPRQAAAAPSLEQGLQGRIAAVFARTLRVDPGHLDPSAAFEDLGVDSILLSELTRELDKVLGIPLDPSLLLEHNTIKLLAKCLESRQPPDQGVAKEAPSSLAAPEPGRAAPAEIHPPQARAELRPGTAPLGPASRAVAIIGLGCRFPGASNPLEFLENLRAGKSSVVPVPASRWSHEEFYSEKAAPGKTISKWGGFVDGIEEFDADFFRIPEADAVEMDPLVRLFLEASVQAIRDGGYDEASIGGTRTGVFVGSRVSGYGERIREYKKNTIAGIGQNFIAAHVSKHFDLKGPCFVLDSACSSSLTSTHLACQSLLGGESELAVAGGVDVLLDERMYLLLTEAKALSPDGRCHTFDLKANGYVPGEGAGAVLLKTLERAMADGDSIYGVILASSINNDGRTMGITTPNLNGQRELIERTLSLAGIDPGSVGYVETHGTGTMIGDPIELKALTRAFQKQTMERQFCALGSVKTNLGHLHSAAGVASLIKVALGLRHREIVASLNCETPNPRFDFAASPFFPNVELRPWPRRLETRRAGISSFGFGGSNGHMIVEEFDASKCPGYSVRRRPLPPARFTRKRLWLEPLDRNIPGHSDAPRVEAGGPAPFLVLQEEPALRST